MKAGLISALTLGLASLALAQPRAHHARHEELHRKREEVHTVVDYVTVQKQNVIVYLDEDGNPVQTSTFYSGTVAAPTPATSAPVAAAFKQVATSSAAPPPPPSPSPASSSQSQGNSQPASAGSGFGLGVSYSPYRGGGGACKGANDIKSDLQKVWGDYQIIRIYGTDCDQVSNLMQVVKGTGKQLIVGVFDINNWQSEVKTIISSVKSNGGDWSSIHTINIGNELVDSGKSNAGTVAAAVSAARTTLRAAGYQGNVITVDTMNALYNNPTLFSTSDYVGMNCHAFFDPNTSADQAGNFVKNWVTKMSNISGGKLVVVTESGWPHQASTNGKASASRENQQKAIQSLKSQVGHNLNLYSAYDESFLQDNAHTFGAEKNWGMN